MAEHASSISTPLARLRGQRRAWYAALGTLLAVLSLLELTCWHGLAPIDLGVGDTFLRQHAHSRTSADVDAPLSMDPFTLDPGLLADGLAGLQAADWLSPAPSWASPALALGLVLLIGMACARRVSLTWVIGGLGQVAVLALACTALALRANVYWVPASALVLGVLALLAFALLSLRLDRAQRDTGQGLRIARFAGAPQAIPSADEDHAQPEQTPARCDVTVLWVDVRGFAALAEQRAPETVAALQNRCLEMQMETIFLHEGTLDRSQGDGLRAFWGAPMAQSRHAELAVQAALDMADALQRWAHDAAREDPGVSFDIGIGVHTGPAVVGFLGTTQRFDYTAMGDTAMLARRIEGAAHGVARVLVSEGTRALCAEAFDFIDCGAFDFEEHAPALRLYEPLRRSRLHRDHAAMDRQDAGGSVG